MVGVFLICWIADLVCLTFLFMKSSNVNKNSNDVNLKKEITWVWVKTWMHHWVVMFSNRYRFLYGILVWISRIAAESSAVSLALFKGIYQPKVNLRRFFSAVTAAETQSSVKQNLQMKMENLYERRRTSGKETFWFQVSVRAIVPVVFGTCRLAGLTASSVQTQ